MKTIFRFGEIWLVWCKVTLSGTRVIEEELHLQLVLGDLIDGQGRNERALSSSPSSPYLSDRYID